jgi:hypothetical protein
LFDNELKLETFHSLLILPEKLRFFNMSNSGAGADIGGTSNGKCDTSNLSLLFSCSHRILSSTFSTSISGCNKWASAEIPASLNAPQTK